MSAKKATNGYRKYPEADPVDPRLLVADDYARDDYVRAFRRRPV